MGLLITSLGLNNRTLQVLDASTSSKCNMTSISSTSTLFPVQVHCQFEFSLKFQALNMSLTVEINCSDAEWNLTVSYIPSS